MRKLLISILCLGFFGCAAAKNAADAASSGSGGGTKTMLSTWTVSNSAWSVDLSSGNLSGTPFTATLTMAGGLSVCSCTTTLSGTDSQGSCTVATCTKTSGSDSCIGNFTCNGGSGSTYSNDGTNFSIVSGATYH